MADRYVVLVTGSRTWADLRTMREVMTAIVTEHGPGRVTFRHGKCRRGADMMADRIAHQLGAHVEQRPADWDVCAGPDCTPAHRKPRHGGGTYCPAAGLVRDKQMVDEGADECLAFIDPCTDQRCRGKEPHGSHGATETARMAKEAGIDVRRFPDPPACVGLMLIDRRAELTTTHHSQKDQNRHA